MTLDVGTKYENGELVNSKGETISGVDDVIDFLSDCETECKITIILKTDLGCCEGNPKAALLIQSGKVNPEDYGIYDYDYDVYPGRVTCGGDDDYDDDYDDDDYDDDRDPEEAGVFDIDKIDPRSLTEIIEEDFSDEDYTFKVIDEDSRGGIELKVTVNTFMSVHEIVSNLWEICYPETGDEFEEIFDHPFVSKFKITAVSSD